MTYLVDTCVWSLALRRNTDSTAAAVLVLREALLGGTQVATTGLVLQELLQGFAGPKSREALIERMSPLAFLGPTRDDHMEAAEVRNICRRNGVQLGTIDALLIQLCIRHDATLLTTDADFEHASQHVSFRLWR